MIDWASSKRVQQRSPTQDVQLGPPLPPFLISLLSLSMFVPLSRLKMYNFALSLILARLIEQHRNDVAGKTVPTQPASAFKRRPHGAIKQRPHTGPNPNAYCRPITDPTGRSSKPPTYTTARSAKDSKIRVTRKTRNSVGLESYSGFAQRCNELRQSRLDWKATLDMLSDAMN